MGQVFVLKNFIVTTEHENEAHKKFYTIFTHEKFQNLWYAVVQNNFTGIQVLSDIKMLTRLFRHNHNLEKPGLYIHLTCVLNVKP